MIGINLFSLSRKKRSSSHREHDNQFTSKMVEVKRAASCTRIQETPEEHSPSPQAPFLEPEEIARIQEFLRNQTRMPEAKGLALNSKQSSTTSGIFLFRFYRLTDLPGVSTQTESSETSRTKKPKRTQKFDMKQKSVSHQLKSSMIRDESLMRRTTSAWCTF